VLVLGIIITVISVSNGKNSNGNTLIDTTPKVPLTADNDVSQKPEIIPVLTIPEIEYTPEEDFTFIFNAEMQGVEITGYTGKDLRLNIPPTIQGEKVTAIGDKAFFRNSSFASITLPDGLLVIGENAFTNSTGLTSFVIPNSVITIGNGAFEDSFNLADVVIGNSVTSIGDRAFANTALTDIILPDSVITIGERAFSYSDFLNNIYMPPPANPHHAADHEGNFIMPSPQSFELSDRYIKISNVTLGNNVMIIGKEAFAFSVLTSIEIPDSVIAIEEKAFYNNIYLTDIKFGNSLAAIGDRAFANTKLTGIELQNNVKTIGERAFYNTPLSSVTLGNGIEIIDNGAFLHTEVAIIELPNSLTTIGSMAFAGTKLTSINIPDSVYIIGDWAFANTSIKSVVIGNGVTALGYEEYKPMETDIDEYVESLRYGTGIGAFNSNPELTSVKFGNSLTVIGRSVFQNTGLTDLTIPDSVTLIGANAFRNTGIVSIVIPDSVKKILGGAFAYNSNLRDVTFGDNIERMDMNAFFGCTSISDESLQTILNWYVGFRTSILGFWQGAGIFSTKQVQTYVRYNIMLLDNFNPNNYRH